MLATLRDFIRRMGGEEKPAAFSADDSRLALAALLVHCTAVDGVATDTERETLKTLLTRNFGLSGDDLDALVNEAIATESEAVDLYRFTSVLKRSMTEDERIRVVENLWEIVFADGANHEFEENLVWRVAELLGVNRRDRIARKRAVAENKSAES
jgi:uncharacterized tellurite resistance protein B-like protein